MSSLTRALLRLLNHLISLVRSFLAFLSSWWTRAGQKPLLLDTGRRIYVGRKLAEGGFSLVFEAYDADNTKNSSSSHPPYVLKRIHGDAEVLEACRKEARVHRSVVHPNVLPLLGMQVTPKQAYLLFPYCSSSLRSEVQRRVSQASASSNAFSSSTAPPAPWSELELLQLFWGVLCGVRALHEHKFSHRDIKLDNVLLSSSSSSSTPSSSTLSSPRWTPVIMDFGSAGPLAEELSTRRLQLQAIEHASTHTTISYRPPELFDGGVRVGDTLDYTKVDVWSLACTLFAMSYGQGASPCECEFVKSFSSTCTSVVKMVDCTHLKILAGLPMNPPPWYSGDLWALLADMMRQDPGQRPTLTTVMERVQALIQQAGGSTEIMENDLQFAVRPREDDDIEAANRLL